MRWNKWTIAWTQMGMRFRAWRKRHGLVRDSTVDIPIKCAWDLAAMIVAQFEYGPDVTVGKTFAIAMYYELKEWLAQDGQCDHSVGICYCSDQQAVHQLGVLLRLEYPTCIFCERSLPSFDMTLHPECEKPYQAGEDTD